jgi:hypothetical protein
MRRHLTLCLVLALAAGCGNRKDVPAGNGAASSGSPKNTGAGLFVGPVEKRFDDMLPQDVLIAVNGVELKRGTCDEILDRMAKTFQAAHPNLRTPDVVNYRKHRAKSVVSEFLTKQLLLQEARRLKLVPTSENKARMDGLLAQRAKWENKRPEDFLRAQSERDAAAIRSDLDDQALIMTLRQHEFGDRLKITDTDIQEARERIVRYNLMCEATNALVKARGISICERLRKGEDFAAVADSVTGYRDGPGGFWGEFARGEIENAAVRSAAFTLPVGTVSDPIDTEEGLVIIKVLDRKGVDSTVAKVEATVRLGRIVLLLGETKAMPDKDTLFKELERKRLEELQRGWLEELRRRARIEYPNGTNFWKKATGRIGK